MKMMKIRSIIMGSLVFLILSGASFLHAQDVQISLKYAQGIYHHSWDVYNGGAEISADYSFSLDNIIIETGINYRTIQWGNQVTASLSMAKSLGSRIEIGAEMQHGLALFYPKSLYAFSVGLKSAYEFMHNEKLSIGVSLELRYSHCPAYKNYGQIYHVTEIPFGIFFRF
jgi:hypothetical protein